MVIQFREFIVATVQGLQRIRDNPTPAKIDELILELQTLAIIQADCRTDGPVKRGAVMTVEFSHKLHRDGKEIEIDVFADNFVSDPSVGIGLGPDEVWAELDGKPFELTDQETEELGILATGIFEDLDTAADAADLRDIVDQWEHEADGPGRE